MFGIGTTELIIIMLVALIVLGPKQLPGIARSLGKALGEFRRVTTDVQRTLNLEAAKIEEEERESKKTAEAAKKAAPMEPATETQEAVPDPEPKSTASTAATQSCIPPPECADLNPYAKPQAESSEAAGPSLAPPPQTPVAVPDVTSPDPLAGTPHQPANSDTLQEMTSSPPPESPESKAQA